MSDYSRNDHYGRIRRRSPSFSDTEHKTSRRQRQERSRSRDRYKRHSYHGSRSDPRISDRSRSPYRNQDGARRRTSTYQSPRRRRPESSDEDEYPRRYRSSDYSSSHRRNSPRADRKRSYPTDARDSQSPPRRSYESRDNYRQSEYRKRSPSPTSKSRHKNPLDHHRTSNHKPHRSNSPHHHKSHPTTNPSPPPTRSKAPLPSQESLFHKTPLQNPPPSPPPKQKPNYSPSGKLAAETNTFANTNIILKYHEPPSARLPPPSSPWRLYIYKQTSLLETLPLHTRSCWLFGRERLVVDVPIEHPSCSKQHAVIQFRHVETKNAYGDRNGAVKPYIIDLESANGTKVNGDLLPGRRYVELKSGDLLAFGESSREYVLLLPPRD